MQHDHFFAESEGQTVMRDRFEFHSPLGVLGRIVDQIVLAGYMRRFIVKRNVVLKQTAESEAWRSYLEGVPIARERRAAPSS